MSNADWRDELASWLEGFHWLWFCSLTFRPGLSPAQARWRLRRWADALREELGTADFGWIAVREFGRTGQDLHYHALVKGLRGWHAGERLDAMTRWWKLSGEARIDVYAPNAGGINYILKNAEPSNPDGIEIEMQRQLFPATQSVTKVNT